MISSAFRQDAVRLEKEIGQSILASDRLAKVENCAVTAARSREFRKKHDKSFREYRKLFRQSLDYTAELERELAETKAELESSRKDCKRLLNRYRREIGVKPKSMGGSAEPGSSPPSDSGKKKDGEKKKRGAPKGHKGASRHVPGHVDHEVVVPAPDTCPCGCGTVLGDAGHDDYYVEDIPPTLCEVTRYRCLRGLCSACGRVLRNPEAFNGPPVRLGDNLAVCLAIMRQKGMTYRALSSVCTDLFKLPISPSGVLGLIKKQAEGMRGCYDEIISAAREEKVLNIDETGWKAAFENGYMWTVCNPRLVWHHHSPSRAREVVIGFLGSEYPGTVICDFYAVYNVFENLQRCFIHYFRDLRAERELLPGSVMLERFETAVRKLVEDGCETSSLPDGMEKKHKLEELEKRLDKIIRMPVPKGRTATLKKRLENHRGELLAFAYNPAVEYHNNRAERHNRPLVISRKNSFGSDTRKGAEHTCILHSVVETCKLNGGKAVDFLHTVTKAIRESLPLPDVFAPEKTSA